MEKRIKNIPPAQDHRGDHPVVAEFQFLNNDFKPLDPVLLTVDETGAVDLSAFPDRELADRWRFMGVPDEAKLASVYPSEGVRFLQALARAADRNQSWVVTIKRR